MQLSWRAVSGAPGPTWCRSRRKGNGVWMLEWGKDIAEARSRPGRPAGGTGAASLDQPHDDPTPGQDGAPAQGSVGRSARAVAVAIGGSSSGPLHVNHRRAHRGVSEAVGEAAVRRRVTSRAQGRTAGCGDPTLTSIVTPGTAGSPASNWSEPSPAGPSREWPRRKPQGARRLLDQAEAGPETALFVAEAVDNLSPWTLVGSARVDIVISTGASVRMPERISGLGLRSDPCGHDAGPVGGDRAARYLGAEDHNVR